MAAHQTLRRLVDPGWLHLLAIEGEYAPGFACRLRGGGWEPAC